MRGLFFLAFWAVLGMRAVVASGESRFDGDGLVALGLFRGVVEEHIAGIRQSLRIIASTEESKSAEKKRFKPLLMRLSQELSTDATVWFALPDGSYFSAERGDMSTENLRDREYFPLLLRGEEVLGALVVSKSTGHRSVVVAVPVEVGGGVIGAVGVSLRVRLLSGLVERFGRFRDGNYFYALNGDSRIVLHRWAERMFKTPSDVGDEELGRKFKQVLERQDGVFDYVLNDHTINSIYSYSPMLGWHFFLAKESAGACVR